VEGKRNKIFIGVLIVAALSIMVGFAFLVYFLNLEREREDVPLDEKIHITEARLNSLYYQKGDELFKKKKYAQSLSYFKKVDDVNPATINCLTKVIDLNNKISKDPKNYKNYFELAKIQEVNAPDNFSVMFIRGGYCSDYESAIKNYTKALELNPKLTQIYELRAEVRIKTLDGRTWETKDEEVQSQIFRNDIDLIIADLNKAIEIYGETDERLKKLVGMYISNEYFDKAFENAEKLPDTDPVKFYIKATCYERLNDPEKVVENLNIVLQKPLPSYIPEEDVVFFYDYIYQLRAKNNLKLLRFRDWFNDFRRYMFRKAKDNDKSCEQ